MKIIIDNKIEDYYPLMNLSDVDTFEINLRKFKVLYIFIDNLKQFYRKYSLFPKNCVFLIDKNIVINLQDVEIENRYKSYNKDYIFLDKVLHFDFIRDYFKGVKK